MLLDYIKSPTFGYLFSFVMGIGIIIIVAGGDCRGDDCVKLKAPPVGEIKDSIYKLKGKCYKFTEETTECTGTIIESFKSVFSKRY
jgi:hypothetical protein